MKNIIVSQTEATASLDLNSGAAPAAPVQIIATPEIASIQVGDSFSDTRPEILEAVRENVRRIRKLEGGPAKSVKAVLWRILRADAHATIAIIQNDPSANDMVFPSIKVLGLIRSGDWVMLAREPQAALRMDEGQLSESVKRRRDRDYARILPLIELGDRMFDSEVRGKVIREIAEKNDVARNQIYRIFRRWLQGGMCKAALVGRWFRRNRKIGIGAALLSVTEIAAGATPPPVGRRRFDESACAGGPVVINSCHSHQGTVKKIVQGMREFGDTRRGRHNIKRAWLLTVAHYFLPDLLGKEPAEIERLLAAPDSLYRPDKYPSERMFRYWIRSDKAVIANLKRCVGEQAYNLKHRPLKGRTEEKTTGPGSNFQIDSTRLDILLVQKTTRRPIGRPTVVLVGDCFSHMIVGYDITLDAESYSSSAVAMLAAAENKVELCKRYGVTITEEQWPSACLCERLHADSGLASLKAHALVKGHFLSENEGLMDLTILPAYRADLKGFIESMLGSVTKMTVMHLPGYSTGVRQRATTDPKAEAALDYEQLHKIVINWILSRNRRVLQNYRRTAEMVRDAVDPTPINLWQWGVAHCSGVRRRWDQDLLKQLCLPQGDAGITRMGLEFRGVAYAPAQKGAIPEFEAWQVESKRRDLEFRVTYHPRAVRELWMHHEGQLIPMTPVDATNVNTGWSWFDFDSDKTEAGAIAGAALTKSIPADAAAEASTLAVVAEGDKLTNDAQGSVSERKRAKTDVLQDRADEHGKIRGASSGMKIPDMTPLSPTIMADADAAEMLKRLDRATKGAK